jgi:hypothetical protein
MRLAILTFLTGVVLTGIFWVLLPARTAKRSFSIVSNRRTAPAEPVPAHAVEMPTSAVADAPHVGWPSTGSTDEFLVDAERRIREHPEETPELSERLGMIADDERLFVAARTLIPWRDHPAVRHALLDHLHGDARLRRFASYAWIETSDSEAIRRIRALSSGDPVAEVRATAMFVLSTLLEGRPWDEQEELRREVRTRFPQEPDPAVRAEMIELLATPVLQTVDIALVGAHAEDPHDRLRRSALKALAIAEGPGSRYARRLLQEAQEASAEAIH